MAICRCWPTRFQSEESRCASVVRRLMGLCISTRVAGQIVMMLAAPLSIESNRSPIRNNIPVPTSQAMPRPLRHSYGSWLAAAGVSPKELMTLARHTDARLTLCRYSHVRLFNLSAAVEKLPTLGDGQDAMTQAMTGTDGRPALADELKRKLGVAPGVALAPRRAFTGL